MPQELRYKILLSIFLSLTITSICVYVLEAYLTLELLLFLWVGTNLIFVAIYLQKVLYPLTCLSHYCKEHTLDNALPPCGGSVEIDTLKRAIVDLVESNEYMREQEEAIFKEAAHELKTPLAILKTRLDLFDKDDAYEKEAFILEAKEDIRQITRQLKDLLFLKSIEYEMHGAKESLKIIDQCDELASQFEPILKKKALTINPIRQSNFVLHTHKKALLKVLLAIFENVFLYAKPKSTITVHTHGRTITITNTICDACDDKLFSSNIGTQMIKRLATILSYQYEQREEADQFITTITFFKERHES